MIPMTNWKRSLKILIASKSGGLCWYCGEVPEVITIDHFLPNRDDNPDNLVPCCRRCNSSKGRSSIEEFRRIKSRPHFNTKQIAYLESLGFTFPEPDYVFWFETTERERAA